MPVRIEPPELAAIILRIEQRLAALEKGESTLAAKIKKLEEILGTAFRINVGVGTVEYPGATPVSGGNLAGAIVMPEGPKKELVAAVAAVEAANNARFAFVINPSATEFNFQLYSTVGSPPAGTKESVYWIAVTR